MSEPADNWLTALGALGAGALAFGWLWLKSYLSGRAEGIGGDLHGKQVILEQAELASLGALPSQLSRLEPKLDQILANDAARRQTIADTAANLRKIVEGSERDIEDMRRVQDQMLQIVQADHSAAEAGHALLVEVGRICRRLESELDWNLRLKAERLGRMDREKEA